MNNIKKLRKQKRITITELANLIGMSQSNLTKIENNQVELKQDIINKIAKALNVSASAIKDTPEEHNYKVELINPEIYNLPALSTWNIPPLLSNLEQIKGYIQPDDTMLPTITEQTLCLIDITKTIPTNGIYLIKIKDTLYLRRIQTKQDNIVLILTDNKSYNQQEILLDNITIIGKLSATILTQKF